MTLLNRCQTCIGTHELISVKTNDYTIRSGDICGITHRAIRDNELDAGCEGYYYTGGKAYFIDVFSDVDFTDRDGRRIKTEKHTDRIIRIRKMPVTCDEWTDVYWETLKLIADRTGLPMNNEGKWISNNVYRCKPRKDTEDYNNGIRAIQIVFTSSIYPHGVNAL